MKRAEALKLLRAAARAAHAAYAPYSKFRVGAALLTRGGRVIIGCNVENASYGLTICAERSAVFSAVSSGHQRFRAVAIVADARQPYPCGACRQVLAEFCDETTPILIAAEGKLSAFETLTLGELLPRRFRL